MEEFGRVWECQNCVTVIENNCSGEFGRIWADLGMPKVCNCYQIHRQRATQATQGAAKGANGCPKMTTWTPYGRQMAAEAELLQQIFSKKFAEEYKTPHPMLNTPKT